MYVKVVWQYSNLWCSVYPLAPIDSIGQQGRTSQYYTGPWAAYVHNYRSQFMEVPTSGMLAKQLATQWVRTGCTVPYRACERSGASRKSGERERLWQKTIEREREVACGVAERERSGERSLLQK